MKKKNPLILAAAVLMTLASPVLSDQILYNDDGSIRYQTSDGKATVIIMDGKTPYGVPIQEEKRIVRRRDFSIEVIYSAMLSDDILDGQVKILFDEVVKGLERWVYDNPLPAKPMRLVISNCRFCKTGYCRRKNIRGITLTTYSGDSQYKEFVIEQDDLLRKGAAAELAAASVKAIMPAR